MMRRTLVLLPVLAIAACAPADSGTRTGRTTIVPGPGTFGFDFSKDGRLAFSRFVDGKAAVYVADAAGTNAKRVSFGVWDQLPLWAPDGKSIAFTRDAGGHNDVIIVPADSGAERGVATTFGDEVVQAWLPDGSGLLFSRGTTRGYETWLFSFAEGTSAKLFDADGSTNSFPSPDSKGIAYTLLKDGNYTVWLWNMETKVHRQLTTEGFESVAYGCFSPDGKSILFTSRRTGTNDLWRLDVGTGEQRQLTQDVGEDAEGRWSPDGTRVVFTSNRGGQPDIWVLATGEADVQRVTDDAILEAAPLWTPDGRGVVAYVALGQPHVYALPVSGGTSTQLTSGDWAVLSASVSDDGSQVAYVGTRNGDADIWTVSVAGGEPVLVSGSPGHDDEPAWSPDGKLIAFSSSRSGNRDVWIAPSGGGQARRVTEWPTGERRPRFSPDGKTLAFVSNRGSAGGDIWTVPVAGGVPVRVTSLGYVDSFFRWSPDGKMFTFSAQVEASGGRVVFTVPSTGGTPRMIVPATSFSPAWSPDGREISVGMCTAGYCVTEIWSPDGKRLRTMNAQQNVYEYQSTWSDDGKQLLIGWQDLAGDGGSRIDIRSSANGAARTLNGPAGHSMLAIGFGPADTIAIAVGGPFGTALQRIDVPAAGATR